MSETKSLVNASFAVAIVLLAAVSAGSLYLNRDLPPILPAPKTDSVATGQLPPDHPPVDMANRLSAVQELSRQDPQNPEHKIQLGNIYYDTGQYDKAIEAYQESLELRPNDPNVETDLATSYHYLGQHDKALEILDRVLKYQPDFPQALFNKGIVLYAGKRDTSGTISVWERLLQVRPDLPQRTELEQRIQQLRSASR